MKSNSMIIVAYITSTGQIQNKQILESRLCRRSAKHGIAPNAGLMEYCGCEIFKKCGIMQFGMFLVICIMCQYCDLLRF